MTLLLMELLAAGSGCDLVDDDDDDDDGDVGDCCSLKASSSLSSRQISEETRLSAAVQFHFLDPLDFPLKVCDDVLFTNSVLN